MVKEVRYTSINRVLDNLMEHPMLADITLEQVIRYTIRFISIVGMPKFFQDKLGLVKIKDFRGELPCDLIAINQVRDTATDIYLRSMTDNFAAGMREKKEHATPPRIDPMNNARDIIRHQRWYIPPMHHYHEEPSFKTQGRIIYVSFPEGEVELSYKASPVDENGFPMLIDNENFLAALEAYIKKQVFTIKFEQGKITAGVLQNVQQEYAWLVGELDAEFTIPSQSEMESITRMWNTLIPKVREFDNGFKHLGDREWIRRH